MPSHFCDGNSDCDLMNRIAEAALVHSPHPSHHHLPDGDGAKKGIFLSGCLLIYIVVVVILVRRQFYQLHRDSEPKMLVTNKRGETEVKTVEEVPNGNREYLV